MKKLMLAAAALAVGSAFAIESSNVVGYQNKPTASSGKVMIAPTFLTVTSEDGCTLADVSVTGYEDPVYDPDMEETTGGCLGAMNVQFLNGNGTKKARYYWVDDGNGHKGWYGDVNGTAIDGGAESVKIAAGAAMWVEGNGLSLVPAGAVNKFDVAYVTPSAGKVAIGNGSPVDITLADLVVSGYSDPVYDPDMEETTGGCLGAMNVQFLNGNGTKKARYYWVDDGNGHKGWYTDVNGTAIPEGAESVKIASGDGMWVEGSGLTLTFPAPEL